jgi:hypothetical protein
MYREFIEVQGMVERLFLVPCLVSLSGHFCFKVSKVSKVCGSDARGIHGDPEDGVEAVPHPTTDQSSMAPLPQGEYGLHF